jgi:transposase
MKKEGYIRAVSRRKPPLTEATRQIRLDWALEHLNWTQEQWESILWSDETWVQPGAHKRQWVTRKIGPEELFHRDCVIEKHQRKIGWMFWGCISGKYGKGIGIFWEKEWKSINKFSYCERIVPRVAEYLSTYSGLYFQQDNAPGHASGFTREVFNLYGICPIIWPPFSPDLSPIETLWDWIKDWIQENRPGVHRNYGRLRQAVIDAWESIPEDMIKELVGMEAMKKRCQAVIDAKGGETKY